MTVDVQAEILIDCPHTEVAAFATDVTNEPAWIGGVRHSRMLTEPPLRVGTQVERTARFLGRRFDYINEVTSYAPGVSLTMRSLQGPFPMTVSYAFGAKDGQTTMTIRVQGPASGFFRLAAPLLSRAVKASLQRDLKSIKKLMEQKTLAEKERKPMGRSDQIAAAAEAGIRDLESLIDSLTDAQWQAATKSEGWSVGVTAHHVADGLMGTSMFVQAVATGQQLPPLTPEMLEQGNARHAQEHANCTRAETLELLRKNGSASISAIRGLSDAQLDNSTTQNLFGGQTMSAEQIAHGIYLAHVKDHTASIRASL